MKKTILAITFLGLLALATPHPAAAGVSVFFGLPGLGLFAGPPVVVAPPPMVVGPSYYGPAYYGGPYWGNPGKHLGWYKHGWHGDRHHEGDWDDD